MTITTQILIDRIEPLVNGQIQVRQATVFFNDGIEINRIFQRWVISPGDDISTQDASVQAVTNVLWTPAVVSNYKESTQNQGL